MFEEHRASHYTAETMRRISECGLNAVRLPLGYWILQEPGQPATAGLVSWQAAAWWYVCWPWFFPTFFFINQLKWIIKQWPHKWNWVFSPWFFGRWYNFKTNLSPILSPQNQSSQLVPVGPDGTVQPRWSPGDGEAFEGPCWETLDTAVELIEASGLQLLLVRLFWVELWWAAAHNKVK